MKIYVYVLYSAGIIFLIAGSFSLYEEFRRDIFSNDFNSIRYYLEIFAPALFFFVSALLVFALAGLLKRTALLDERLDSLIDTNSFNNFYRHREEFINFMKGIPFFRLSENQNSGDGNYRFLPFYNFYFYKNYTDFKPSLNENSKKEIRRFYADLRNLNTQKVPLNAVDIGKLRELWKNINPLIKDHITIILNEQKNLIENHFGENIPGQNLENEIERLNILTAIRHTLEYYEALITFEGKEIPSSYNFPLYFEVYKQELRYVPR